MPNFLDPAALSDYEGRIEDPAALGQFRAATKPYQDPYSRTPDTVEGWIALLKQKAQAGQASDGERDLLGRLEADPGHFSVKAGHIQEDSWTRFLPAITAAGIGGSALLQGLGVIGGGAGAGAGSAPGGLLSPLAGEGGMSAAAIPAAAPEAAQGGISGLLAAGPEAAATAGAPAAIGTDIGLPAALSSAGPAATGAVTPAAAAARALAPAASSSFGGNWLAPAAAAGAGVAGALIQRSAAGDAADAQTQAAQQALAFQKQQYQDALGRDQPYADAGLTSLRGLQSLTAPGSSFGAMPTLDDLKADPGYQARLDTGQQALQRYYAGRGGSLTGGTAKALSRYGQDYASNEYGNVFNRKQATDANTWNRQYQLLNTGQQAVQNQNLPR